MDQNKSKLKYIKSSYEEDIKNKSKVEDIQVRFQIVDHLYYAGMVYTLLLEAWK